MNDRGFTLVELLVAISVIGIIASLGVVQLQKYREEAIISETHLALSDIARAVEGKLGDLENYSHRWSNRNSEINTIKTVFPELPWDKWRNKFIVEIYYYHTHPFDKQNIVINACDTDISGIFRFSNVGSGGLLGQKEREIFRSKTSTVSGESYPVIFNCS